VDTSDFPRFRHNSQHANDCGHGPRLFSLPRGKPSQKRVGEIIIPTGKPFFSRFGAAPAALDEIPLNGRPA
jgi:hypothetical protein